LIVTANASAIVLRGSSRATIPKSVLAADGTPEALREAVLSARTAKSYLVPLGSLLGELMTAGSGVVACFLSDGTYHLVLRRAGNGSKSAFRTREMNILKRIMLGEPQKVIALDLQLSATSVAMIAARVVRALGFDCPASRIPMVLMMAAQAELEPGGVWVPSATLDWRDRVYQVVRVARPNPQVLEDLSESEQSIVELLIERRSNAEIARARHRSDRTVANQLGSILRKLGVSNRAGVLSVLAARWCHAARALGQGAA
jgi:DNA-binding NarL/FixJ family response regulator